MQNSLAYLSRKSVTKKEVFIGIETRIADVIIGPRWRDDESCKEGDPFKNILENYFGAETFNLCDISC
jgi:hypothetical protein